jgi:hypothetical protein
VFRPSGVPAAAPQEPASFADRLERKDLATYGAGLSGPAKLTAIAQTNATPLEAFYCPSRRAADVYPFDMQWPPRNAAPMFVAAKCDYAMNGGDVQLSSGSGPLSYADGDDPNYTWPDSSKDNGICAFHAMVSPAQINDGLSLTYLAGEKNVVTGGLDLGDDQSPFVGYDLDNTRWTTLGWTPVPDGSTPKFGQFGSAHPTVCELMFCDGSVRDISFAIDAEVHRRLGNRHDDSFKDNEPIRLDGGNEDYGFTLQRPRNSETWILTNFTCDPELVAAGSIRSARRITCVGLRSSTGWLPEMVDEPGFSVDHAETRNVAGETLVDVTFRYLHTGQDDNYAEEGHMLLDPSRCWLLREAEVKVREPPEPVGGSHAIHVEYKDSDGLPVPKRRVMSIDVQATEPVAERGGTVETHDDLVCEYDFNRVAEARERDFTLSAFGIPEPVRPAPARSATGTRLFAAIVIGTILIVVGIMLRRRLSRAGV